MAWDSGTEEMEGAMDRQQLAARGWRRQRGAVLFTTLIFLAVLTILGVTTMQGTRNQERMAGNFKRNGDLERAAETALRTAVAALRNDNPGAAQFGNGQNPGGPNFVTINTGTTALNGVLGGAGLYDNDAALAGNPPRPFPADSGTSWNNGMIAVVAPNTPPGIQGQFYIQRIGVRVKPGGLCSSTTGASNKCKILMYEVTARGVRGNDGNGDNVFENVDDQVVLQARVGQL